MIKFENVEVMGWEAAIRGMRNPMNSWEKSDSEFKCSSAISDGVHFPQCARQLMDGGLVAEIGTNDLHLMTRLRDAGTDHRKFMRMITVYMDITAPLYWWKEFDTYKVGTVANSCSTMHKIADKEFTQEDFSCEHIFDFATEEVEFPSIHGEVHTPIWALNMTIHMLNFYRKKYLETKDKKYWWQMIQLLPSSYNQRRTVMLNYEVLANIYKSRRNHKLDEWVEFCKWIENLPYSELITGRNDKKLKITSYDDNAGPIIPDLTPAQGKELTDAMSLIREENE